MSSVTSQVAIATNLLEPGFDADGPLLAAALSERGVEAVPRPWDDPGVDWSIFDAVLVRSTSNYVGNRAGFVRWAAEVEAVTRLANPARVLSWNTDKRYLDDLAAKGAPVVPTVFVDPKQDPPRPGTLWDAFGGAAELVVKPSVSAGARDTARYAIGTDEQRLEAHLDSIVGSGRTAMVQPYLPGVEHTGETALVYFAGRYSHAVAKAPLLDPGAPPRDHQEPGSAEARKPTAAELEVAEAVLDATRCRADLVYARVDLVPAVDGSPALLELECTEPFLYLAHDRAAPGRFAEAVVSWLTRST